MARVMLLSLNHDPLGRMGQTHAGGQAKYVLEVAKHLALRGWGSVIYTIGGQHFPAEVQLSRDCLLVRLERECGRPYDYDVSAEEACRLGEAALTDAVERELEFSLVYACFWLSGLAARAPASFFHIPILFSFCQLGTFKAQWDGNEAVAERIAHERAVCEMAHAIVATNRDEITSITADYGVPRHKVHFIPRGVDLQAFFP
jgi:glycosyltransferase involved in cell wall biosynthesis